MRPRGGGDCRKYYHVPGVYTGGGGKCSPAALAALRGVLARGGEGGT